MTPANNTANNNIAIGYEAMNGTAGVPSTGYQNVAVGSNAMKKLTS